MIVTSVKQVVNFVRDSIRTKVYKTIQDPVTMKEMVTCEVYTKQGVVSKLPDKGQNVDKKS